MASNKPTAVYVAQWLSQPLHDLGRLPDASILVRAAVACGQRLAAADPGNAGWQRDLWTSYWRMGAMTEQSRVGDAREWWRKAYDVLADMKRRQLFVSPQDEQFLDQLRVKLGL